MFSIFNRKANTGALQEVPVMEQQESPVVEEQNVNIASLLVIAMTEYLKDAEQKSRMAVPVIADVRKQYDRLMSLGMGATQNAISLKQHIDEADKLEYDLRKANELIAFVKAVHSELSGKSILVSNRKFEDICKRYGLQIASLSNYCGVIPEKNIQDVEKVKENIERFSMAKLLNKAEHGYMLFVNKANLHSDDFEVLSFMEKQLYESMEWDCKWYEPHIMTKEIFLSNSKDAKFLKECMETCKKRWERAIEAVNSKNKWLKDLRESLRNME